MLSDEVIDALSERVTRRLDNLNTYIIKQIGERIKEIGKLTPTQAQQLEQILRYGGSFNKITKEIAKVTNLNEKEIYEIYEKVAKQDQQFASTFYKYRNMDYIPYDKNTALQNQVNALAKITADTYVNFSNTKLLGYGFQDEKTGKIMFKGLEQAYYDIIDEGILSISQGKETFDRRMSKIIKDIGESGLKVIYPSTYETTDKNGNKIIKHYTRRADSAIRMNLQEGLRTLHNTNQELFGNEFGANMIQISHHENAAPDHIDTIDGKQFAFIDVLKEQIDNGTEKQIKKSDIQGNKVKVDGKWYYDFDYINNKLERPVGKLNCRHYTFRGILGISKPKYTEEELEKAKEKNNKGFVYEGKHYTLYEGEQLMRKIELELRKAKDTQIMARASGINEDTIEDIAKAQKRITALTTKYKEVLNVSGLKSQIQRARVSGYRRIKV